MWYMKFIYFYTVCISDFVGELLAKAVMFSCRIGGEHCTSLSNSFYLANVLILQSVHTRKYAEFKPMHLIPISVWENF